MKKKWREIQIIYSHLLYKVMFMLQQDPIIMTKQNEFLDFISCIWLDEIKRREIQIIYSHGSKMMFMKQQDPIKMTKQSEFLDAVLSFLQKNICRIFLNTEMAKKFVSLCKRFGYKPFL